MGVGVVGVVRVGGGGCIGPDTGRGIDGVGGVGVGAVGDRGGEVGGGRSTNDVVVVGTDTL